jgi:diaminopimelate decarboxylase
MDTPVSEARERAERTPPEAHEPSARLYPQPPRSLFYFAERVATPALLYDIEGLSAVVRTLQADIAAAGRARLNLALKSCHSPPILEILRDLGVGCDVASVYELRLARHLAFQEISATAPAFSEGDLRELFDAGVTPDLDSLDQIELCARHFPAAPIGLRIRLELPPEHESHATFGADSRFGILPDEPALWQSLERHRLTVTRLHIHCGQSTPESLLFKARALLALAERLPAVSTLDLGGGLFHLYIDRAAARRALRELGEAARNWEARTGRSIELRLEPGGAILATAGYLVAQIRSVARHRFFAKDLVTVDASAWNLAPWHRPQVLVLPERAGPLRDAHIAGNTLYEGDFFGSGADGARPTFALSPCQAGDRLLFTCSGAYTMTNGRRFHRIPLPAEYAVTSRRLAPLRYSYPPGVE